MSEQPTISLFGLGKLGSCMAACFAARGSRVIGVDVDQQTVDLVNSLKTPIYEPGLEELFRDCDGRLTATTDGGMAVAESDITFVVVPTPSDKEGRFSLEYVRSACEEIGAALKTKQSWHLVVVTSTVMPGDADGDIVPLLEKSSAKRCGQDFGLCYNPEFIALGSVIRDFLNPDLVLIGESNSKAGEILARLYLETCQNSPAVERMSFVNAELAKLAINTYVTSKISFANMLASICERLPDADVDVVTEAVGLDTRIGRSYLKGAAPYGGPCFPRDVQALIALGRSVDVRTTIAEATDDFNRQWLDQLISTVVQDVPDGGTVGILGLAYKPNTDVIDDSPGLRLVLKLVERGIKVAVHDPAAMESLRSAISGRETEVVLCERVRDCISKADVLIVATPWQEYRDLSLADFVRDDTPRTVIDCWRIYGGQSPVPDGVKYVPVGRYIHIQSA